MGDLRNKAWKEERDRRVREMQERLHPALPPPPPICCGACGRNFYQTTIWQVSWSDARPEVFRCKACMTPDQADLVEGLDPEYRAAMCNLYSMTKGQAAIRELAKAMTDLTGNLPPLPAVFPNRMAPVVRHAGDGRELLMMRWGLPPPNIPGQKPRNPYLTNCRKTDSRYWLAYLKKPEHRCLVPVTSFAEPDNRAGEKAPSVWTWFAQDESRPLMFFAGIWREWEGDRGTKASPDIGKHLVFSFLTTDASPDVAPIHPDATPVLLLDAAARDAWMNAPWEEAQRLQAPPPAGALTIVAAGRKDDP
jgi:putative SOS response-associated peptidase YedK